MKRPFFARSFKKRSMKPIHWVVLFVIFAVVLAWMMIDTTTGVTFRHSVRRGEPASRVLHIDDDYRIKMQGIASHMAAFCERGSDIVFGHNVDIEGKVVNDHVFHICGGNTWLNARVFSDSDEQVACQEEFSSIYRTVPRSKRVRMKAIDVMSWSEREVSAEGKDACMWKHATEILERTWVGLV